MRYYVKWVAMLCALLLLIHLVQNLTTVPLTKAPNQVNHRPFPSIQKTIQIHQQENDILAQTNAKIFTTKEVSGFGKLKELVLNMGDHPNLDSSIEPQLNLKKYEEVKMGKEIESAVKKVGGLSKPNTSLKRSNFSIVTAADSGHFLTLLGALWALQRTEDASNTNIYVYDLGFKNCQRKYLDQLVSCFKNVHVWSFNYPAYPSFFDIQDKAGSYGWKPAIINEVLEERQGDVVWIDAGTELGRRLQVLLLGLHSFQEDGFISSTTTGSMQQWTHPGMIDWFELNEINTESSSSDSGDIASIERRNTSAVRTMFEKVKKSSNCNGAFVGFKYDSQAREDIVPLWNKCGHDITCIAPEGSTRRNHRQDQSALTLLTKLYLKSDRGCFPMRAEGSMRFWRDIYYEVNAPIVFGYQCSNDVLKSEKLGLICDITQPSLVTASSSSSLIVLHLNRERSVGDGNEFQLLVTIAYIRQYISEISSWARSSFHLLLLVSSEKRLGDIETLIGTDSFVSVLFQPSRLKLQEALSQFKHIYTLPLEEKSTTSHCVPFTTQKNGEVSQLVVNLVDINMCLSAEGTESTLQQGKLMKYTKGSTMMGEGSSSSGDIECDVFSGGTQNIDIFMNLLQHERNAEKQSLASMTSDISTQPCLKVSSRRFLDDNLSKVELIMNNSSSYERKGLIDNSVIFDQNVSPILLNEAAVEKEDQIRIRKLKKSLPKKGVVLALFAQDSGQRTQLAITSVLMGALGFGLRWKHDVNKQVSFVENELVMNDLHRLDNKIIDVRRKRKVEVAAEGGGESLFDIEKSMDGFTRKSKKEVKHAPWIMVSEQLATTFDLWRQHLDSYVCVVLPHHTHKLSSSSHQDILSHSPSNNQKNTEGDKSYLDQVISVCGEDGSAAVIVVDKMDAWGIYMLYQKLRAVVGNVRALSPDEVEFISSLSVEPS